MDATAIRSVVRGAAGSWERRRRPARTGVRGWIWPVRDPGTGVLRTIDSARGGRARRRLSAAARPPAERWSRRSGLGPHPRHRRRWAGPRGERQELGGRCDRLRGPSEPFHRRPRRRGRCGRCGWSTRRGRAGRLRRRVAQPRQPGRLRGPSPQDRAELPVVPSTLPPDIAPTHAGERAADGGRWRRQARHVGYQSASRRGRRPGDAGGDHARQRGRQPAPAASRRYPGVPGIQPPRRRRRVQPPGLRPADQPARRCATVRRARRCPRI